jgi:sodium/proline symporter
VSSLQLLFSYSSHSGWNETVQKIGSIDPSHLDVYSGSTVVGVISLLAWGLGYFGQPHILVRFMGIQSTKDVPKARLIGMVWMIFSLFGAVFVGFAGIAYFADTPLQNSETVFIMFSQVLFNPWGSWIFTRSHSLSNHEYCGLTTARFF